MYPSYVGSSLSVTKRTSYFEIHEREILGAAAAAARYERVKGRGRFFISPILALPINF